MIHPIRLYGDPVLRRRAVPVRAFDDALRRLADDMIETLHDAGGVGLAGPQIGRPLRIFVALELEEPDPDAPVGEDGERPEPKVLAEHVLVNPEIVSGSGRRVAPDGCLSVPGIWIENMVRHQRVEVRYQDLDGAPHALEAEGHFAHVIQHEADHLDGVLYFDRLDADDRARFLDAYRAELAELQRRAKAHLKRVRSAEAAT